MNKVNKKVTPGELVKLTDKIFNAFAEDFPNVQNQPLKVIAADDDGVTLETPIFGETEWSWMAVIPAMPVKSVNTTNTPHTLHTIPTVKPVNVASLFEDIDDSNAMAELVEVELA